MSHQSVEAARGHAWFRGAIDLIAHNPVPLLVIALLFVIGTSVVSLVPVLGTLAVIALTPVLGGGFMYALREEHEGRGAQIEHLFRGFQEPGRLLPLMLLGVPALVAGILVAIALLLFVGAAALQMLAGGASLDPASIASLGVGVLVALLFGLLLVLAAAAIVVFAVPRVMLDGIEPIAAMKESLAASLSNIGALLVFTLMFVAALLALLVATALVGWIPLLGQLVALLAWFAFGVGWIAVSNGGVFLAYRDLWPASAAPDIVLPYGPPPPAPPTPPAP